MTFRKRYDFLDGIRGMAALFVLTRHTPDYWKHYFFRSYLAVDLFFLMSGFVIALNYDAKLKSGELPWHSFARLRLIRLYPVYALSALLCIPALMLGFEQEPAGAVGGLHMVAVALFAAAFLPFPVPGDMTLYSLNGAYWSLLFELAANFVYALCRPLLNRRTLVLVIGLAAIVVAVHTYTVGKLDFGFEWGAFSIFGGFMRAVLGIFAGLLLYAWRDRLPMWLENRVMPWLAIALTAMILASPDFGALNWAVDMIVVLLVFPAVVATLYRNSAGKLAPLLSALGAASYPVYVLHVPLGDLIEAAVGKTVVRAHASWSGLALVLFLVVGSIALERYVDIPLRKLLTRNDPRKNRKHEPQSGPAIVQQKG